MSTSSPTASMAAGPSKPKPGPAATPAAPEKKSGKDAKVQKAARRAERVASKGAPASEAASPSATPRQGSVAKPGNSAGGGAVGGGGKGKAPQAAQSKVNGTSAPAPATTTPLQLFLHLDTPPPRAGVLSSGAATASLHPAVVRLAQMYAEFKIVGANARCIAMLEAFREVIRAYTPPANASLSRHLPTHLSPHISHLVRARPLAVSMGNAIRYLKSEISLLGVDVPDDEAKELLCERIDHFIRDRIVVADKVIEELAISKINEGDVILTYARSSVVQGVLLEAHKRGIPFSVVLVDSRPMYEAKHLLRLLSLASIPCTYVLLPALGAVLPTVDLCLLGTHALLSNGAMYGRAGQATVAMMARSAGVPVVCCCETYKFTDRIMLDSIVSNEMGTAQSLVPPASQNPYFPLPPTSSSPASEEDGGDKLTLVYDVARPEDVTVVITEAGMIPVQSVPVLQRDYKPLVATE